MDRMLAIPNIRAYLALVVVYIVWGTTFGFIHIGADTIPPALLVFLRFVFAGALLLIYCRMKGEPMPDREALKHHFIIGALMFFGGNSIVSWATRHVPVGLSGTLTATGPFWMVALSALIPPREKIQPVALIGLLMGFAGILILLSPQILQPAALSPMFWPAILSMFLMTFSWCTGSIYAKKKSPQSSMLMGIAFQNLFAALLLLPICLLTVPTFNFTPSLASLGALAYLVLFGTIVAMPCYLYVLKRLPIAVSSTFAYVTPIVNLIFGILFLGEQFLPTTGIGIAVILSGVLLVQWVSQQRPLPFSWSFRFRSAKPDAFPLQ